MGLPALLHLQLDEPLMTLTVAAVGFRIKRLSDVKAN